MRIRVAVRPLARGMLKQKISAKSDAVVRRAAALVRQEARRSIKVVSLRHARKKSSPAGHAPQTIRERKSPLKTFLVFEKIKQGSYIVGTRALPNISYPPVPGLHEHAGSKYVTLYEKREKRTDLTNQQRKNIYDILKRKGYKRPPAKKRRVLVRYPQRPFMEPALKKIKRRRLF